jgi:hypothetical protein
VQSSVDECAAAPGAELELGIRDFQGEQLVAANLDRIDESHLGFSTCVDTAKKWSDFVKSFCSHCHGGNEVETLIAPVHNQWGY